MRYIKHPATAESLYLEISFFTLISEIDSETVENKNQKTQNSQQQKFLRENKIYCYLDG